MTIVVALALVGAASVQAQSTATMPGKSYTPWLVNVLATWIATARDDALVRGVEPIPETIRLELEGFVPTEVLDGVRWRVDGGTTVVGFGLFALGPHYAITLDNVVLFASAEDAANSGLWAHELYHVMQYRDWGIEGFVERYLDDRQALERDAKDFRYEWWKATKWQEPE